MAGQPGNDTHGARAAFAFALADAFERKEVPDVSILPPPSTARPVELAAARSLSGDVLAACLAAPRLSSYEVIRRVLEIVAILPGAPSDTLALEANDRATALALEALGIDGF